MSTAVGTFTASIGHTHATRTGYGYKSFVISFRNGLRRHFSTVHPWRIRNARWFSRFWLPSIAIFVTLLRKLYAHYSCARMYPYIHEYMRAHTYARNTHTVYFCRICFRSFRFSSTSGANPNEWGTLSTREAAASNCVHVWKRMCECLCESQRVYLCVYVYLYARMRMSTCNCAYEPGYSRACVCVYTRRVCSCTYGTICGFLPA